MKTVWDEAKRAANVQKHGVDFAAVDGFDWETSVTVRDDRFDYGEELRYRSQGFIGAALHILAFTFRAGDQRVISLRKANTLEVKRYEKTRHSP